MIHTWKKIKEEEKQLNFYTYIERTYILPDGAEKTFEIMTGRDTAGIVALTKEKNVLLTKQFRPGPEKILMDLPGGFIDSQETPEKAVERELLEETGYIGDIQFVRTNIDSPYSTRTQYNFVATNCHKIQDPKLDHDEFIEVVEMPLNDFKKHIESGEFSDVETAYMGLHFLKLI